MGSGLEDLFGDERPGEPNESEGELARAMVIAAHPDDADFGAAGTAALLAKSGWTVRYLIVTDGSKGSDDLSFTPETLVVAREDEQRAAAELLGVESVRFLGFTDGELAYSRDLLGAITREIREFQPFAVYTHDPEPVIINEGFVNHSDHRTTGLTTVDAVYPTARDRLNFPEHLKAGLATHKVRELYLWGANEPTFDVDISEVMNDKIAALVAHTSQFPGDDEFIEFVKLRAKDKDGRYVERFRRIVLFR
ncbi:MAG: PIG-L deacetylase family protein [Dehalococcoidia bacterium]|jgi:LmbE family N-acetylglucosaminyl deacetylase|nr:PIG-L deacetylase family protein [Dehalococcoidia bacterium]